MSEPIKAGDLVVVVRSCCSQQDRFLGKTFVAAPCDGYEETHCCGKVSPGPFWTEGVLLSGGWSKWYLQRIQPRSELDVVEHDEEITA